MREGKPRRRSRIEILSQTNPERHGGKKRRPLVDLALGLGLGLLAGATVVETVRHQLREDGSQALERVDAQERHVFGAVGSVFQEAYTSPPWVVFFATEEFAVARRVVIEDIVSTDGRIISAWQKDAEGRAVRLSQDWLDAWRAKIKNEHPELREDSLRLITTINQFGGSDAVSRMDRNEPAPTYAGLSEGYASQLVLRDGTPGTFFEMNGRRYTRAEYIREFFATHMDETIPLTVRQETARLAVGLAMQESGFRNNLTSPAGAMGIFQFMPRTLEDELGGEREHIRSFEDQIKFAGEYFSRIYTRLMGNERIRPSLDFVKNNYFAGDEEKFYREFLVPLMINSYNAGSSRMGSIVVSFATLDVASVNTKAQGIGAYGVYAELIQHGLEIGGGYGPDASGYVPAVLASASIMTSTESESDTQ